MWHCTCGKFKTPQRERDCTACSITNIGHGNRLIQSARTGEWFKLPPIAQDEKTVAERKWQSGLKPAKPQQPCDVGLFGDEMNQVEMFAEPTND